jgi:hypothetical protein
MELWQMDIVGGFPLIGTSAKALTGTDDHSRKCVCARLMAVSAPARSATGRARRLWRTAADPDRFTGRFNHPLAGCRGARCPSRKAPLSCARPK